VEHLPLVQPDHDPISPLKTDVNLSAVTRLPATPVGNGKHTAVTAPTVAKKRPTDWRNAAGAAVNYVMRSH